MAHQYFRDDLVEAAVGGEVVLGGAEAKHSVTVSRTRVGDRLQVTNGQGLVVGGAVSIAETTRVVVAVDAVRHVVKASPRLVLVQALAKGDRDELAVQAAVELGVDVVLPWQASRSVSRWLGGSGGDKARKGVQRWSSIVREATKQSMRAWLPEVGEPVTTGGLASLAQTSRMLVLEPGANEPLTGIHFDAADDRDIVVVVGPEGGVAPEESARLAEAGARSVRLGESVLRTSSAGPAALAVLNAALGRW